MSTVEYNDQDFRDFLSELNIILTSEQINQLLDGIFAQIGMDNDRAIDENRIIKIKKSLSDIINGNNNRQMEFVDYLTTINILSCYIEYYNCQKVSLCSREEKHDLQEDSLIIGYYFSRENDNGLTCLGYKNFNIAFKDLSTIMNQKWTTLKNMRDEFDPYFDNGRKGWYQRKLSPSRQVIFDRFENVKSEELNTIVKDIISYYNAQHNDHQKKQSTKHYNRIVVSLGNMKEINSKKK